jgi:hypothetical protein
MAVAGLSCEFAALSGNTRASALNGSLRKVYCCMADLAALQVAVTIAQTGNPKALRDCGAATLKDAERKIKELNVKLKEEMKHFDRLSQEAGNGRASLRDYNGQIAAVSKYAGFHISKHTVMLDEYAAYVKQFNTYINHLHTFINHGKN